MSAPARVASPSTVTSSMTTGGAANLAFQARRIEHEHAADRREPDRSVLHPPDDGLDAGLALDRAERIRRAVRRADERPDGPGREAAQVGAADREDAFAARHPESVLAIGDDHVDHVVEEAVAW